MRAKNIPTPCCSNSWVRKVQLNYVNAEMNVLCRTSTGDTCRDCSDISSCERLCCISLDVLNARKKKKSFQELSCCGDCDVFVFVVVFLHLACQRSLLITLPFIRAGGLSRSTWEQGQDGETVASQAIENALVLPAGAAQLSDPDADVHRQHLLGLFRVSPDTILRLAAEWERAQIMTEGGRLRIVPVSLGSNGHKCKV